MDSLFSLQEGMPAHQEGFWHFLWFFDRKCGSLQVDMIRLMFILSFTVPLSVSVAHFSCTCRQLRVLRWPGGLRLWSPWRRGCGLGPGREILDHAVHTESSQDPGEPWPHRETAVPAAVPPGISLRMMSECREKCIQTPKVIFQCPPIRGNTVSCDLMLCWFMSGCGDSDMSIKTRRHRKTSQDDKCDSTPKMWFLFISLGSYLMWHLLKTEVIP